MAEPCIIARLFGGLGNQLFIYAFARALAERNGVPLRLDVTGGFVRDPVYQRQFLLDRLLPSFVPASRRESRVFPGGRILRSLERKVNGLLPLERRWFVQERGYRGEGAPPALPDEVRCEAARRYIEAYERITGSSFAPDVDPPTERIRRNLGLV